MPDVEFGIELCAKYLKEIIKEYELGVRNEVLSAEEIYEYIASQYLSGTSDMEDEIVKLYAAVLEAC